MSHRLVSALALSIVLVCPAGAQTSPHDPRPQPQPTIVDGVDYRVYDRDGNRSDLLALVNAAMGDDVLLVGEEHDDMIGHAFETALYETVLEEIGGSARSGRPVVLSLEMFERDVQYILDEYLAGEISEDHFLRSSRPWDDYEGRYRPLVEAARAHGVPVVAANAPRRYVSRVTEHGPESLAELSSQARAYLPPLPYPGPSDTYRAQWEALMTAAMSGMGSEDEAAEADDDDHADADDDADHDDADDDADDADADDDAPARGYVMSPNAIYSQALWDASMGHAITQALVRHIGGFVVHFAGSFHVGGGTGIPERLADYRPGTRVTTVVMTKVDDIEAWSAEEHATLADFVVLTVKPEAVPSGGN